MERLTLERAICRVKIVAKNQRWNSKYTKVSPMNEELNKQHEADYIKDAEEHEQIAEWLEELKSYKDIGTLKELKELKENGAFTGLELAKLAIMQKELKEYKDLEEHGLLVRLPANKNAEIYLISSRWTICSKCGSRFDEYSCSGCEYECDSKKEYYVRPTCISSINVSFYANQFGKTIFLTREEAEKKLEEFRN
jgi:hypothetical protein